MSQPITKDPDLWHTAGRLAEKFPDPEHALALAKSWTALRDLAKKKKGHDLELPVGVGLTAAPFCAISQCRRCGYIASFTRPRRAFFGLSRRIKYKVLGRRALGWRYKTCQRAADDFPRIKKEKAANERD